MICCSHRKEARQQRGETGRQFVRQWEEKGRRRGQGVGGGGVRPAGEDLAPKSGSTVGALQREVVGCMVSHNKQPGDNCTTF